MTKQERAEFVLKSLSRLYPNPKPALDFTSNFELVVSVLLSAQTTDKRVNIVTPELFRRANTPAKMMNLNEKEILEIIRTCGLAPQKAKAIVGLSKILVEKHGGEVPRTLEELEELPGVGHKTASVVMIQGFGIPAFPVDTHIHRLAKRWKLSSGKSVTETERDLKKLFPESTWIKLHLQIIYYGREHCTARGCNGNTCQICSILNGVMPKKKKQD
ncbi:MAG: endonuclease III [Xanthomonadaceae bacterium]|nr:endonuclease III [Xanthomonadaceae bacterium]